jgi:hypothetical protein
MAIKKMLKAIVPFLVAVILAQAVAIGAMVISPPLQRPFPRAFEARKHEQSHAGHKDQASGQEQHGAGDLPLTEDARAKDTQREPDDEAEERNRKASLDWWTLIWVGITALATSAMFIIGGAQAGLFWWQLDLIRKGLVDTKGSCRCRQGLC